MYWNYLKSLLKHKYYVFIAGRKIKANVFLLLIHDISKFRPSEFIAYANYFFGNQTSTVKTGFDYAWLYHQRRNKHHWQYWILVQDDDPTITCNIPDKYILEMVSDWIGAGLAYNNPNTKQWYLEHQYRIKLSPESRNKVESLLDKYYAK